MLLPTLRPRINLQNLKKFDLVIMGYNLMQYLSIFGINELKYKLYNIVNLLFALFDSKGHFLNPFIF